jgi:hypothetical protein
MYELMGLVAYFSSSKTEAQKLKELQQRSR